MPRAHDTHVSIEADATIEDHVPPTHLIQLPLTLAPDMDDHVPTLQLMQIVDEV